MNMILDVLKMINGYKTYASVILAIVSGSGLVLSKNYSQGLTQILQSVFVLFSGASVASLRHAVSKVEAQLQAKAVG